MKKSKKNYVSDGCALLAEFMRQKCLRKSVVAKELRVSHATVGRWLTGERRPTREHRIMMQAECGIAENSWLSKGEAQGVAWRDRGAGAALEAAAVADST